MTNEDLKRFCSEDIDRISRPWSRDGYTYASDGHVLVRVSEIDGILDNPEAPDINILERLTPYPENYIIMEQIELPDKKISKCPHCKGRGTYYGDECEYCDGLGQVIIEQRIMIGEYSVFSSELLRLLKQLPVCEIGVFFSPPADKYRQPASRFRFDGGDGFIMPITK